MVGGHRTAEGARGRRGARAGQALVWVVLMTPFFLAIVGLAIDGGLVFAARRELQNAADAAARAGAVEIDLDTLRATDGSSVVLDTRVATTAAAGYVSGPGIDGASVGASPGGITVSVRRAVPLSFLRLVGLDTVTIEATASAAPFYGIARGERP